MPDNDTKPGLSLIGERALSSIYDEVFLNCTDGYCIFDEHGVLTSYSSTYPDMYPLLCQDIHIGLTYRDYMYMFAERRAVQNVPEISDIDKWVDSQIALTNQDEFTFTHHLYDGRWMNVKLTKASSGQWLFAAFDVTELFVQKLELSASHKLFKSFATLSSDWFWELDANLAYLYHSEHKESPSGFSANKLIGKNHNDILSRYVVKNQQLHLHVHQLNNHEPVDVVLEWRHEDGTITQAHVLAEPQYRDEEFSGYLGCGRDVTEEYRLKEKLNHLASHDDLTTLLNRRALERNLESTCRLVNQKNLAYSLCFIDLDRFKLVNDGGGHEAGDALLKLIADLFKDYVSSDEFVARLGGDEFAIIMYDDVATALSRVEQIIAAVRSVIFVWKERKYSIGASAGLVAIDSGAIDVSELLSRADAACYESKNAGRNQARVYLFDEYAPSPAELEIKQVNVLRAALDNDELLLYLQPLKPLLQTTGPERFEVLLRLIGSDKKTISAGVFIPVAEKYDLMQNLDRWVIENSLKQLSLLHEKGINASFAINLSGNTLSNRDCLENCENLIREFSGNPENVCFEITETAAIKNLEDALFFIDRIKQLGCKFALDDFGAGMSSFGYLKSLPVDYLKIDGSFVKAMQTDPTCKAIVSAFNNLSHELGMKTVAEFVEDSATEALLKEMGVDYVQGYGICEPRPLPEWKNFLVNKNRDTGT